MRVRGSTRLALALIAVMLASSCGKVQSTRTARILPAAPSGRLATPLPFSTSLGYGAGVASPPPPGHAWLPPVVFHIPTHDRLVFFTVDDGAYKDAAFLKTIQQTHIPITVFLMNDVARDDYQYFRDLQAAGADIEDHTLTHPQLTHDSPAGMKHEICGAADIYKQQFGNRPTLLRPPYGASNTAVQVAAGDCGMSAVIQWSVEFRNGNIPGYHDRMDYAPGASGLEPGDIILMHFRVGLGASFDHLLSIVKQQGFTPEPLRDFLPAAPLIPPVNDPMRSSPEPAPSAGSNLPQVSDDGDPHRELMGGKI